MSPIKTKAKSLFSRVVSTAGKLILMSPERLHLAYGLSEPRLVMVFAKGQKGLGGQMKVLHEQIAADEDSPFFWVREATLGLLGTERGICSTCNWRLWKSARAFACRFSAVLSPEDKDGIELFIEASPESAMGTLRIAGEDTRKIVAWALCEDMILDAWDDGRRVSLFLGEAKDDDIRGLQTRARKVFQEWNVDFTYNRKLKIPMESLFDAYDLEKRLSDIAKASKENHALEVQSGKGRLKV